MLLWPGCCSNYNKAAKIEDDSCVYGCVAAKAPHYGAWGNCSSDGKLAHAEVCKPVCATDYVCAPSSCLRSCDNGTISSFLCLKQNKTASGCTNPGAQNYNGNATVDDGSCVFACTGNAAPVRTTQAADKHARRQNAERVSPVAQDFARARLLRCMERSNTGGSQLVLRCRLGRVRRVASGCA